MDDQLKTCQDCCYCVFRDTGYSVWTVLNTDIDCLLNLNNNFPDEIPVADSQLLTINSCECFTEGDPIHFNVDGEIQ